MTVCILPAIKLSEEAILLITAIANQIEVFYLPTGLDADRQKCFTRKTEKEAARDTYR